MERTLDRYGFLRGDDGRQYFFLPSAVAGRQLDTLLIGARVVFTPYAHPKGLRARAIVGEPQNHA